MKGNYDKQHRLALHNPYGSVVKVLDAKEDDILVGIKNVASIPNTLMHKLEPHGFSLHTIDKKSQLAGRAVDTELINPITGHYMSGSSSGTALNVFAGINDLGIGNDGGGSVLAPAMCVNIYGFISKLIEADRQQAAKANTDGIVAGNSLGFMARKREILFKAIQIAIGVTKAEETGVVFTDRVYPGVESQVLEVMDANAPRNELTAYLKDILTKCDVFMITEGPVDLHGFGDSLFGHFDERTKQIQMDAAKGYVRVCNIAGATALCIPQKGLGMATLLMCESKEEKIAKLLKLSEKIEHVHDELIERYFLDLDNYFNEGYQI
ncbi:MAG: hypothetical protein J6K75_08120 [Erysipelotrichaceae bacterium]|nr:hypothetical protein [Erysipelotrichaceae bacterium]MBQ7888221.1 hypothetical protein [Erysipelotrichaceae bacterium]MBQ7890452.1 hypothetical protein [Erysipelotrichaceae bacterium]